MDLPVTNRKAHRVAYNNDRDDGVSPEVLVRVDAVRDGQLAAHGDARGEHIHGENESEPVDMVRRADAPEDQAAGHDQQRDDVQPEAVLGLADAAVASGFPEDEFIAYRA